MLVSDWTSITLTRRVCTVKSVACRDVVSNAKPAVVIRGLAAVAVCAYDELRSRDGEVKGVGG